MEGATEAEAPEAVGGEGGDVEGTGKASGVGEGRGRGGTELEELASGEGIGVDGGVEGDGRGVHAKEVDDGSGGAHGEEAEAGVCGPAKGGSVDAIVEGVNVLVELGGTEADGGGGDGIWADEAAEDFVGDVGAEWVVGRAGEGGRGE